MITNITTTKAQRLAAAQRLSVRITISLDDYYKDVISHETMGNQIRAVWDQAKEEGLTDLLCDLIRRPVKLSTVESKS